MDRNIGILHLSDVHACEEKETNITELVKLLINDLNSIKSTSNANIDLVCITGDLINSGDNSDKELDIFLNTIICPLMENFNLSKDRFLIVPGNHEVKRSRIIDYIETGLQSTLNSEEDIEKFTNNIDLNSLSRVSYFNDFLSEFGGKVEINNPLMHSHLIDINGLSIGSVCVNSAWRSTGIGYAEKGKMIIGRKQIIDGFSSIKSADIKICMMHHPLDWLTDQDKTAIEKCINDYDIILSGHIHETSTKKYISYNGQAIYNTCGKFDNTSDIYNGYNLICINPYNKACTIYLRQYFGHPRNCFDKAIGLHTDGVFNTSLSHKDDMLALAYNITHSIREKFIKYANGYFVSNVYLGKNTKSFDEAFILPTFSKYSEYEKETAFSNDDNEKTLTLDQICNENKNILLLGKKGIGKTTILHYIINNYMLNFNELTKVPILIDCLSVNFSGKDIILRAAHEYVNTYCCNEDSFSKKEISSLLESGHCTILFDNFDTIGTTGLNAINDFISKHPNNKFVFSEKESIGAHSLRTIPVVPNCKFEKVHICSLTKGQIRSATKQYTPSNSEAGSSIVDTVMLCFKKTTLPKTPFVLSLILSLCDGSDFIPLNEATILEQFMESLLEKHSPEEVSSYSFDFKIKEDFLIYIVSYMHEQNRYILDKEEFYQLAIDYHNNIGFSIQETKFDKLFFEKGILIDKHTNITFRYSCMIEYYLAKKAGQNSDFLNQILQNKNYLHYPNELLYYTGLNRKDIKLLQTIQNDLISYYDKLNPVLERLKNYNIGIDISMPENTFKKNLIESRFSQENSDIISDSSDTSEKILPESIDKYCDLNEKNSFIDTLLIYGNCLKNLELISCKNKEEAYDIYLLGLCIMLSIFQSSTEDFFNNEILELEKDNGNNEEQILQVKNTLIDILKIALPISIQNIALENIGTLKLKSIFERAIENSSNNEFKKFFSVFLFTDLRLPGIKNTIQKYVNHAEDKSLLKIILFKLVYYYQIRYFSPSLDPFLEDIMADINIKLQSTNKFSKSKIIKKIKGMERHLS